MCFGFPELYVIFSFNSNLTESDYSIFLHFTAPSYIRDLTPVKFYLNLSLN